MSRTFRNIIVAVIFAGIFMSAFDGHSMDVKQRLAIIKGLKIKGIVGENNKGYLEFRTSDTSASAIVNEENADRKKAYSEIAKKTGASVSDVGAQRAAQIAQEESSGVWIQKSDGTWYKKQSNNQSEELLMPENIGYALS